MKLLRTFLALTLLTPGLALASLSDLIGDQLVDASGKSVPTSSLEGKIVGLYFSAEWCPPCRAFTPELVKFQKANAEDFQVVFVSSDRSAQDQMKYMTGYKMTWPAVPFDSAKRGALGQKFGVQGIPALIIVNEDGELISSNGRAEVSGNAEEAVATWQSAN